LTSIIVTDPTRGWLRVDEVAIKADLDAGMSGRDIAKKYGISPSAVSRVNRGKRDPETNERIAFCKKILEHEGKWELIRTFENSLLQVDGEKLMKDAFTSQDHVPVTGRRG